jgi:hypothetical protein
MSAAKAYDLAVQFTRDAAARGLAGPGLAEAMTVIGQELSVQADDGLSRDQLRWLAGLARMAERKARRKVEEFSPRPGQPHEEWSRVLDHLQGNLAFAQVAVARLNVILGPGQEVYDEPAEDQR